MTATRYRCGPRCDDGITVGCGGIFEHDDGPDGLFAPMCCPLCNATFCGPECCGNEAEQEREFRFSVQGAYESGETRHPQDVILELYPEARYLRGEPVGDCWLFLAFPRYPQKDFIEVVW